MNNMNGRYDFRSTTDIFHLQSLHTARTSVFAHRRFSIYAPQLWNNLPAEIRSCIETESFKKQLKAHIFITYENSVSTS